MPARFTILIAAVVAAGCSSTRAPVTVPATSAAVATAVVAYQPWSFGGELKSVVDIAGEYTGSCFSQSAASSRPDAFRCIIDNAIQDPCFAPADASVVVVCPVGPEGPVNRINLDAPVTFAAEQDHLSPWLIELDNGASCGPYTGAMTSIGDLTPTYGCTDGVNVLGPIDTSSALWTVQIDDPSSTVLRQAHVLVAWN